MLIGSRPVRVLALAASLAALGCRAQTPATPVQLGVKLPPAVARRIELMIRSRAELSPDYVISISEPAPSEVPGYDLISVSFASGGKPAKSASFLLSADGKTLAQFNKFDISRDPMDSIPVAGRPARGGPPNAPVQIVGFDDLECPFCAQMNAELPAVLDRYKDKVRIVYRDFPLEEIHPWAMHAAVDANCLAAASTGGYWNYVDYVHAHSADMAGPEKTVQKADQNLDRLALDEGERQKVDHAALQACIAKQDDSNIKASIALGESEPLRLDQAPVLFINGERVEGVVPVETLYAVIDRALVAAGQTPPPPPQPAPAAAPAKPGS